LVKPIKKEAKLQGKQPDEKSAGVVVALFEKNPQSRLFEYVSQTDLSV
jgi:hypothetical protein